MQITRHAANITALVPPDHELARIGPIFDQATYLNAGLGSLRHLQRFAGLKPHHDVLDVGCGYGRVAIHLLNYLEPSASYLGLEIVPCEVDWCREKITPLNPRFRFRKLDVRNPLYNPKGHDDASSVRFPTEGQRFDVAFLFSVFTHMRPADVRHYLTEIRRHLKPRATLFASFFLINDETLALIARGNAAFQFVPSRWWHRSGRYYYDPHGAVHECAIAYSEADVRQMVAEAGFTEPRIHFGQWSGRASGHAQDFLVTTVP